MTTTVGIVPHPARGGDIARRAARFLAERGVEVRVPVADADAVELGCVAVPPAKFAGGLDFAVAVGGDGTVLRTVDLVGGAGVPVLSVNVGHLGFITEIEPADLESALSRVLAGDYLISERMVLSVQVTSAGPASGTWLALNEAVLEKLSSGHLVRLDVSINGNFFSTYSADGIIVATPTGSTAYNFSARGPIVSPNHRCLVLTPVSPHMLFNHPLVLGPEETLDFRVAGDPPVGLTLDGREMGRLSVGDRVSCTAAAGPARLIMFDPRDFHQVLKAKFGLSGAQTGGE